MFEVGVWSGEEKVEKLNSVKQALDWSKHWVEASTRLKQVLGWSKY